MPSYVYITVCLCIHPLIDYCVISILWLSWIMLPETQMYKYLFESLLSVLLGTYSEVELQDQTANLSEKEMANHSSILAWRIPWTEEPGRLQSIGLQRLRHDWSNLARMHARMANLCLIFSETVKHLSTYPQWLHHFTFLPAMHKFLPILVYTYFFFVLDYNHPNNCEGEWNFDRQRRDKPGFQATDAWEGCGMRWIQSHKV